MSFYRIGEWERKDPEPSETKNYAVTLAFDVSGKHDEKSDREVSEQFWRYTGEWQFFYNGDWQPLTNENYKVIAHAEVTELEPYSVIH